MSNSYNVVVGGGIAGIVTAYLLSKSDVPVLLIEKGSELGGLLRSKYVDGQYFDFGTHIPNLTGIEELDDFLFSGLNYKSFDYLKNGTYFQGLFEGNGFLSDSSLTKQEQEDCLKELTSLADKPTVETVYPNLEEQLISEFGNGYYEKLLKPIISSLFFSPPELLSPNAHLLFGLSRLVCGTPDQTRQLKTDPFFDKRMAFHSYEEGQGNSKYIYPVNNGIGDWVNLLENKLNELGVVIKKGKEFELGIASENKVTSLKVDNEVYRINNLYWTVPPVFLYSQLKLSKPVSKPPKRLSSIIVDLKITGDYSSQLYYFQVFDYALKSFRVTLYDNYNLTKGENRITVEFLSDQFEPNENEYSKLAKDELRLMNLVSSNSTLEVVNVDIIKGGFPVPTTDFKKSSEDLVNGLINYNNLVFFGKATGKNWFMNDVLKEIHSYFQSNANNI